MKAKLFAAFEVIFLISIMVSPLFVTAKQTWLLLAGTICLLGIIFLRVRFLALGLFSLTILFLSVYHFQGLQEYYLNSYRHYSNETAFKGTIVDMPIQKEYSQKLKVRLEASDVSLFVYAPKDETYHFGQKVVFTGKIKNFDRRQDYFIKEKTIGELTAKEMKVVGQDSSWSVYLKSSLFGLRERYNQALQRALPSSEASLASGLILGEKQYLSAEFVRDLQGSGTSHIIALSGYNITIIIALISLVTRNFSKRVNLLLPASLVIAFVVMTGGSASIVRASIMGLMPVFARFFNRQASSFFAILFSATVMVLLNPFVLLYDVGFQLSFVALVGMIYLGPILSKIFGNLPETPKQLLAETLGAQIAVLPLLLYYFGYVSVVSPLSNMIILGLIPLAMLAAFLTGLIQLTLPALNSVLIYPFYAILHLIIYLIRLFGSLPFAAWKQEIDNPYIVILIYLFFVDFLFLIRRQVTGRKHAKESN